jgi:hypothetical protein
MDVSEQLKTYHSFMIVLRYIVLTTVVSISLLTILFCTSLGWGGGICVAIVELAIGIYFAKERKGNSWQTQVAELIASTEGESGQPAINQTRPGVRPGTLTMWAISTVLLILAIGAVLGHVAR